MSCRTRSWCATPAAAASCCLDARIVSTHLIGPNALGFAFGCLVILQVRNMVMRRQLFATAVLAGIFVVAASLVATEKAHRNE